MSPADAFKDETGRRLLSKTAVAELGKPLWEDSQAFNSRDLAESDIAYLFIAGGLSGSAPGSGVSRCWRPGASPSTAARCCST